MPEWISIFYDAKHGGYHARWRSPSTDQKRKVPHKFLRSRNVNPLEKSDRGRQLAYQWAVHQSAALKAAKIVEQSEARTVAGLLGVFEQKNPGGVLELTMKNYKQRGAHLVAYFDEKVFLDPAQIDRSSIAEYIRWRESKKPQPTARTIRGEIALLTQLLAFGVEQQIIPSLRLVRGRRMPKIHAAEPQRHALTPEQIKALLMVNLGGRRQNDIERAKRIIAVGPTTMLRRSNLYRLRWEWIDIENKWLTIPAKAMKAKRELSMPLSNWTIAALGQPKKSGFVFPSPSGGATKHLQSTFDAMARAAGVPRFTPHALRRSGYTWLAEAGVERIVRKVMMGHQSGIDVSDLYDRSFKARMIAAAAVFDAIYGRIFPLP